MYWLCMIGNAYRFAAHDMKGTKTEARRQQSSTSKCTNLSYGTQNSTKTKPYPVNSKKMKQLKDVPLQLLQYPAVLGLSVGCFRLLIVK
jgi:hypothetical protein